MLLLLLVVKELGGNRLLVEVAPREGRARLEGFVQEAVYYHVVVRAAPGEVVRAVLELVEVLKLRD